MSDETLKQNDVLAAIADLAKTLNNLETTVNTRLDNLNIQIDNLETTVNTRIDKLERTVDIQFEAIREGIVYNSVKFDRFESDIYKVRSDISSLRADIKEIAENVRQKKVLV